MSYIEKEIQELNLLSNDNFGVEAVVIPSDWIEEEQRRENECKSLKFKAKKTKQLKAIARTGLSNSSRRRWWFFLSGGFDLYNRVGNIYEYALDNIKDVPINEKSNFGISFNLLDFVPPNIASLLPTFLHAIWYHNQEVEYSPIIPAISSMLLMYMEPPLAYLSLQSIINTSKDSQFFLLLNKKQYYAQIEAIEKLISIRLPSVSHHARKLDIKLPQLLLSVFPSFFIPFMKLPISLTFFDSFMSEGRKVFYRFILQILNDEKYNLINTSDSNEFGCFIFNAIDRINNPEVMKKFTKKAFQIKLKRKNHIEKLEKRSNPTPSEMNNHIDFSKVHIMANKPSSLNIRFNHRRTNTYNSKMVNVIDLQKPPNNCIIKPTDNADNSNEDNLKLNPNNNNNNDDDDDDDNDNNNLNEPKFVTFERRKSTQFLNANNNNNNRIIRNSNIFFNDNNNNNVNGVLEDEKVESGPNFFTKNGEHSIQSNNSFLNGNSIENLSETPKLSSIEGAKNRPKDSDLASMKNIHAMVAQRTLPAIYSHGESNLILNEKMLLSIRSQLSPVFLHYSADLVFKLSVHGSSFKVLFSKSSFTCQYILVVKTTNSLFGAFLSDPILPKYKGRYFGTRMTFVFNMKKNEFYKRKVPVNSYYISVSDDTLMIGGPDPAIYIQNEFKKVYSNKCESFNSPILTEDENGEDIIDFEVYRFIPHHIVRQRRKSINSLQKNA